MRTEIKIGVAVGGFIALVAVIYFAYLAGPSGDKKSAAQQVTQKKDDKKGQAEQTPPPGGSSGTSGASGAGRPSEHLISGAPKAGTPSAGAAVDHTPPEAGAQTTSAAQSAGPTAVASGASKVAAQGGGGLRVPGADSPVAGASAGGATTGGTPAAATVGKQGPDKETIYFVQEDDIRGFWGIAEKVYGDKSLHALLSSANPEVDPTRLRVGQKIITPPRPAAAAASAGADRGAVSPGSVRKYIVRQADRGFLDVSRNVYGSSKHWRLIAEANPGVQSERLREGMGLVVPALNEEAKKEASGGAPSTTTGGSGSPAGKVPVSEQPARPVFD